MEGNHHHRLTAAHSHARYQQQAAWTESLRRYLFARVPLFASSKVLEVGCGTGAVFPSIHSYTKAKLFGVDLALDSLRFARPRDPSARLCAGNALALPYADGAFDAALCHYFLLWVSSPRAALAEMARVTKPGGVLLALAEPDYGGRVDYPPPLDELGALQAKGLASQGANPRTGRELGALFHEADLEQVQTGVLGGEWTRPPDEAAWALEWDMLAHDLQGAASAAQVASWREADRLAWASGARTLFVPTFYALGYKRG